MQPTSEPKIGDFLALAILATVWATSFAVMKILLDDMSPLTISALRTGIAGLLLLPLIIGKKLPKTFREWRLIFGIAIIGYAIPFTLIPLGETQVNSGLAGMLMATGPVSALIINHIFTKDDRATKRKIIGVAIGLMGTAVIFGEAILSGSSDQVPYIFLILLASLGYVFSGIFIRHLSNIHVTTLACICLLIASTFTLPIPAIIGSEYIYHFDLDTFYAIFYLGAIPTALAFTLRFMLIRRTGYTFFSYVGYLIPALSLLIGAVILDEALTIEKIAALSLILIGLSLFRKPS